MKLKSILMSICCISVMMFASNAKALTCDLTAFATTITLDSGTGYSCNRTGDAAQCSTRLFDCGVQNGAKYTTGSCPAGTGGDNHAKNGGGMIGGGICCGYKLPPGNECPKFEQVEIPQEETVVTSTDTESLGEALGSDSMPRTDLFFGWRDSVLRSSNAGRTTSAQARLDACLFYTDVDALTGADNSEKWTNCVGSSVGCENTGKNEYCNATGTNDGQSVSAAVCKDRCDCVFGQGTCAGL